MSVHVNREDHVLGPETAPVTLIEYADYQCPYCKKAYYIVKEIQREMGDKVRFVFRNFPLAELHPYAVNAAVAAEVAGSEGKFWEMHDLLFENQPALDDYDLIKYAQEIGMDESRFKQEFGDQRFIAKVQKDYDSGLDNGVEGTPAFFINGKMYEGDWTGRSLLEYMQSLVD